jgi:hypothetical protein
LILKDELCPPGYPSTKEIKPKLAELQSEYMKNGCRLAAAWLKEAGI